MPSSPGRKRGYFGKSSSEDDDGLKCMLTCVCDKSVLATVSIITTLPIRPVSLLISEFDTSGVIMGNIGLSKVTYCLFY